MRLSLVRLLLDSTILILVLVKLLVVRVTRPNPPPFVLLIGRQLSDFVDALCYKFHLLKPGESPLPFHQFLKSEAQAVRVILFFGRSPVDASTIATLPCLQCIVHTSTGVEHIDLDACKRRGIVVTNAGTVFSEDAADYAVGSLIDVMRRISAADLYVRHGLWGLQGEYPLGSSKVNSLFLLSCFTFTVFFLQSSLVTTQMIWMNC
ncbi:glyoxylate/hydroxypyruvate reductase HPR3-like [Aristolochia californica]|uniref:glyoxylate/hydroxypyruvate reductase HPR3-like n=1 Tax=Aristolochia californica TaxID=171875 RepID=UPI0035DFC6F8